MGFKVGLTERGGCTDAHLPCEAYTTNTTGYSQPIDLTTLHKVFVIASAGTPLSNTVITVEVSSDYHCGGATEINWTGVGVTFDILGAVNGVILSEPVGAGEDLVCDALDSATIPVDSTGAPSRYMRLFWDLTDVAAADSCLFAAILVADPNYMGGTGGWGCVADDWDEQV